MATKKTGTGAGGAKGRKTRAKRGAAATKEAATRVSTRRGATSAAGRRDKEQQRLIVRAEVLLAKGMKPEEVIAKLEAELKGKGLKLMASVMNTVAA